jgi:serine/threonine protein kinase
VTKKPFTAKMLLDRLKKLIGPRGPRGPRTNIEKRFQTIARVGQGSMSKLWKARDLMTGRTVALKVLDMDQIERQTERMRRAYNGMVPPTEGELSVKLKHPNVVQTFDHGVTSKRELFLVMEFIEGVGLNFLVETRTPQMNGKRIPYLIQAADGLAYVHQQQLIHRDFCPRNLMVSQEGVVKIIDFGLTVPNTSDFCRPGNRAGTANYMAPELIKRETTDERIDIFAFGVTAYECMTGRLPWDAPDTTQMMVMHMNTPPKDPREVRPDIDETFGKLLLRMLAQNPKKRIGSMKEVAESLRALPRQDY